MDKPAEFFAHPKSDRTKLFLSQILQGADRLGGISSLSGAPDRSYPWPPLASIASRSSGTLWRNMPR